MTDAANWRRALVATPAGTVLAVTRDGTLVVLCFAAACALARERLLRAFVVDIDALADAPMPAVAHALDGYFLGGDDGALRALPVAPAGTEFQQQVWAALQQVPRGSTITYGELAARLQLPGQARAVAQAVAANLLHLVVPCHRVLPARGGIGGFNAGVDTKEALLALEQPRR